MWWEPSTPCSSSGWRPQDTATVGPIEEIPDNLPENGARGSVAYQYSSVTDAAGRRSPALIIGTPTSAGVSGLELYLVFPLTNEESTVSLVRGTIFTAVWCCSACSPPSRCWCRDRW